jgi:nucleoside 2-deoxyribosyltransferase
MKTILEQKKIKAYTAEHDPQLGKRLSEKIQEAIENSDALIAIVSRDHPSASANQEVGYALKLGIPVIPLIEKGAEIGFMLGDIERVSFEKSNIRRACDKVANFIFRNIQEPETEEELEKTELLNLRKIVEDYEVFSFSLLRGSFVKTEINSDAPVDVFLLDTRNLNLFEDGRDFYSEEGENNVSRVSFGFEIPSTRKWHLIIVNQNKDSAEVDIRLTLREPNRG